MADRSYFVDRMAAGTDADLGLTNDVVYTEDGTVIKEYDRYPLTSLFTGAGRFAPEAAHTLLEDVTVDEAVAFLERVEEDGVVDAVLDTPVDDALDTVAAATADMSYVSQDDRMQMEEAWPAIIGEHTDLRAPAVETVGADHMEFAEVAGENLKTYAETAEPDELYTIAADIGGAMDALHAEDYAFVDNPLNNYMVDPDGVIWSIDHEYATDDATDVDKALDVLTFLADARHLSDHRYRRVREGLVDGYEADIGYTVDAAAAAAAPAAAMLLHDDDAWTRNAVQNAADDIKTYLSATAAEQAYLNEPVS